MPKTKAEPKIIMDTQIVKESLIHYYKIKEQISELENKLEIAKSTVIEALKIAPEQKMEIPGLAKFSLRRTTKYQYSEDVSLLENQIKEDQDNMKALKKQEEEEGVAKLISETFTPVVSPVKE